MTTENWINVAMIIAVIMTAAATLFGPVLAVYVQVRMSQPKPMPDVNKPPPKEKRPSRFHRVLLSPATPFVALIVDVLAWVVLIWIFIRLPLSKLTIALFVYASVSLGAHFASILAYRLLQTVYALRLHAFQTQTLLGHLLITGQVTPPNPEIAAQLKAELDKKVRPRTLPDF